MNSNCVTKLVSQHVVDSYNAPNFNQRILRLVKRKDYLQNMHGQVQQLFTTSLWEVLLNSIRIPCRELRIIQQSSEMFLITAKKLIMTVLLTFLQLITYVGGSSGSGRARSDPTHQHNRPVNAPTQSHSASHHTGSQGGQYTTASGGSAGSTGKDLRLVSFSPQHRAMLNGYNLYKLYFSKGRSI